jgi:hypothetical protein
MEWGTFWTAIGAIAAVVGAIAGVLALLPIIRPPSTRKEVGKSPQPGNFSRSTRSWAWRSAAALVIFFSLTGAFLGVFVGGIDAIFFGKIAGGIFGAMKGGAIIGAVFGVAFGAIIILMQR